tara:strand:+ start:616 stop:1272 length:657 start_codon:yes stop_codon:yes gene_type:complete
MQIISTIRTLATTMVFLLMQSCSTIESTVDSTWDSISEAGDFIYDSVNFWDEDEPQQSEAVIIEEAVEVPEYAIPDDSYFEPGSVQDQSFNRQQNFQPQANIQPYYDPIYRSQRQYYYVGPNGTPMLAPPPPPFPQYSIDQAAPLPYSYSKNLGIPNTLNSNMNNLSPNPNLDVINQSQNVKPTITLEEEMELFGIQNDCVRVKKDYVNGGFMCDDYD